MMGPEFVDRTVFHADCHDPNASALVHEQIQDEVLDEEVRVMSQ